MKHFSLAAILFCVSLCSCSPQRWFLVNTSGIMTYNRNTGQLEMIWEWNEKSNAVKCDSIPNHSQTDF